MTFLTIICPALKKILSNPNPSLEYFFFILKSSRHILPCFIQVCTLFLIHHGFLHPQVVRIYHSNKIIYMHVYNICVAVTLFGCIFHIIQRFSSTNYYYYSLIFNAMLRSSVNYFEIGPALLYMKNLA